MGHLSKAASQHIHFVPRAVPGRKTLVYDVMSLTTGVKLAEVKFFPRWRGWVLAPVSDTIWSASCLDYVREFIRARNAERKGGRR
jgi:hypothetical protein